jgi:cytochrome c oxidase subunit 3
VRNPALDDHVREPFADDEHQRRSATLGTWTFVGQEIMFFAVLFTLYSQQRLRWPEVFEAGSRETDWLLGALMTGVLLVSSATMVFAVRSAIARRGRAAVLFLAVTALLGLGFLALKFVEYREHFLHGQLPGNAATGRFWAIYYVTTGFHAVHVIGGIVTLTILAINELRGLLRINSVIMTGLYWHFVDLVWIFLYPLLYLLDPKP